MHVDDVGSKRVKQIIEVCVDLRVRKIDGVHLIIVGPQAGPEYGDPLIDVVPHGISIAAGSVFSGKHNYVVSTPFKKLCLIMSN